MSNTVATIEVGAKKPTAQRLRLDFLDGLRGLAAICVLLFHAGLTVPVLINASAAYNDVSTKSWMRHIILFNYVLNDYGHQAVVVFIVLSGYCLMLPVARGLSQTLTGGVKGFIKRRARRILPAYYVTLIISILLAVAFPSTNFVLRSMDGISSSDQLWGAVTTHLLLVHNWSPWSQCFDGPMWSLAVEWQIYFIFALLLLPIYRCFGLGISLSTALILGLIPIFVGPYIPVIAASHIDIIKGCPWMLGCFGVGTAAATVQTSSLAKFDKLRNNVSWMVLGNVLIGIFLTLYFHSKTHHLQFLDVIPMWFSDYIVAGAAACYVIYLAQVSATDARRSFLLQILECRMAVILGAFSYSLYLTHALIITIVVSLFYRYTRTPLQDILVIVIAIPVSVLFAYVFHLAFERPFMPGHPRTERQAEIIASISPAP